MSKKIINVVVGGGTPNYPILNKSIDNLVSDTKTIAELSIELTTEELQFIENNEIFSLNLKLAESDNEMKIVCLKKCSINTMACTLSTYLGETFIVEAPVIGSIATADSILRIISYNA